MFDEDFATESVETFDSALDSNKKIKLASDMLHAARMGINPASPEYKFLSYALDNVGRAQTVRKQ